MSNNEQGDNLTEYLNDDYKIGFDMITAAILNEKNNHKESLEDALTIAMNYRSASSMALYKRNIETGLFHRFSFVENNNRLNYAGISDSCLVNYLNRNEAQFNIAGLDINFADKKTHIDILPIETFGNQNHILIIIDNNLTRPHVFNEVMQRGLKTILTNIELQDRIELARVTDSLTGIKNREGYYHRIGELFKNGTPRHLVFTITDLLKLKTINDKISHVAGDDYIRSCAESLHTYFRRKDGNHIYRIGGDEFVILSEKFSKEDVDVNIKKSNIILRKLMHKYSSCGTSMDFMINHGSAEISDELYSPQALYTAADNVLSENKKKVYSEARYERRS